MPGMYRPIDVRVPNTAADVRAKAIFASSRSLEIEVTALVESSDLSEVGESPLIGS